MSQSQQSVDVARETFAPGRAARARSHPSTRLAWAAILCAACGVDPGTVTIIADSQGGTVGGAGQGGSGGTSVASGEADPNSGTTGGIAATGGSASTTGQEGGAPGGGSGASDSQEVCEVLRVASNRIPPDMLIILDRSTSMQDLFVDRWGPSVSGIKRITASLEDVIDFGLMKFPGGGNCTASALDPIGQLACQNQAQCAAGSLDVPIAANSAAAIAAALDNVQLVASTPTAATLQAAHSLLGNQFVTPDQQQAPAYVLLVTDGAPNCGTGGFGLPVLLANDVQASVDQVASMAQDGIKTFVLGYGTKSDPGLSAALDRMAVAGNTGDAAHRAIEDEASLVAAFEEIAGRAVSCEYVLETAPSDPKYVLVELDQTALALGSPDGWSMSADQLHVTLEGSACAMLKGGGLHDLTVTVQCEPVIVQ